MNFPKFVFVALSARGGSVTLTETPPTEGTLPTGGDLLLESGGKLLLEDGTPLELE